jgi:signal transduction histidine kinase
MPPLSPRVEAELLRIAQEALNNVRKHADATTVRLRLTSTDAGVTLVVTDNGCGFDVGRVGRGGFGLQGMHERTDIIGGRLVLDSRPSDGTTVTVTVPWRGSPA